MIGYEIQLLILSLFIVLVTGHSGPEAEAQESHVAPHQVWSFEELEGLDRHGMFRHGAGIEGQCATFDGTTLLTVAGSQDWPTLTEGFTLTMWVNPYRLSNEQQMLAARNVYSADERQWGVMIDRDNRFRLYVWQGKWQTVTAQQPPRVGHWHQVGVVLRIDSAELWLNGELAGHMSLADPIPSTRTALTFGGVNDGGHVWQNLVGALDEVRWYKQPLEAKQLAALFEPVAATHEIPDFARLVHVEADPEWDERIGDDAAQDRSLILFDGRDPDRLACDTTLRRMPDGSWVMVMLGGGNTEPLPANRVYITRSFDEGQTWGPLEPVDLGVKQEDPHTALVPSELMVLKDRCTLFVATHDGTFGDWKEWMTHSTDSGRTWSQREPVPGRLHQRTFVRNAIHTRDGRILLPFQHYLKSGTTRGISGKRRFSPPQNPRNGVLMSSDGGRTWTEHGDIRISSNDDYHGWAENNVVELSDGRVVMIIRADRLGGVLYLAESSDGGRSWPEFARRTPIPNPGSKATLYSLGGDAVALLHNPNPRHRSPLALWISFDGMKSWPYQRVLVPESCDGPRGRLNYPDGFVSRDGRWLHFAFDDNRHRGVMYSARLPQLPGTSDQPASARRATVELQGAARGWKPLMNGEDLSGWHRQKERGQHGTGGNWGVTTEGVLFGEQDPPGSGNGGLLLSDEQFQDFELELSLRPDWGPDSGVFLRTDERGGGWQVYVDHHDHGNVGHIRLETKPYSVPFRPWGFSRIEPEQPALEMAIDERTGNWPEGVYEYTCSPQEWLEVWKNDDWNRLRIRCTGAELPVIETWINGRRICRFNAAETTHPKFDPDRARAVVQPAGSIGLQVHGGTNWKSGQRVYWKDLRVRHLGR